MQREDLGNGVEYVSDLGRFPGLGQIRRKLTQADLKRLRSYLANAPEQGRMSGPERWILYSLAWSGIRLDDLAKITWANINLASEEVKTDAGTFTVPRELCDQLADLRKETDARSDERVFPHLDPEENPTPAVNTMLDSDCRKAHLSIWPERAAE